MDKRRIENAINIIQYSMKEGVSIKKSAKRNGFGDTYVKNVKSSLLKEKIDGIVASIMALDRCLRNQGEPQGSVYDERGLLVF